MTLQQVLAQATGKLADLPDAEPVLEAEILLRHVLSMTRAQLYLEIGQELNAEKALEFETLLNRRLQGEPLAYIIGHREFFNLDFYVDSRVLIPRPETEHLVEAALEYSLHHPVSTLADIGTGSVVIAVSVAKNLSRVKIYATDISAAALEVARLNCQKHLVADRVVLLRGNLLEPLPGPVDLILANLPYVKKADLAGMPSIRYEPVSALDGGEAGLDYIFQLIHQLPGHLNPGGCLMLEIGLGQAPAVTSLMQDFFPTAQITVKPDLAGINRVIIASFKDA